MNIIIDTSNKDLFISIVNQGKTIKYELLENLSKKADELPKVFTRIMEGYKTKDIDSFYITIGPGSFTGARTALVFARSICQVTGASLYTTSSIQMIAGPNKEKEVYIDARSNMSYFGVVKQGRLVQDISLVDFKESTKQYYEKVISNPEEYFTLFSHQKDILEVKPLYIKEPKIGH